MRQSPDAFHCKKGLSCGRTSFLLMGVFNTHLNLEMSMVSSRLMDTRVHVPSLSSNFQSRYLHFGTEAAEPEANQGVYHWILGLKPSAAVLPRVLLSRPTDWRLRKQWDLQKWQHLSLESQGLFQVIHSNLCLQHSCSRFTEETHAGANSWPRKSLT